MIFFTRSFAVTPFPKRAALVEELYFCQEQEKLKDRNQGQWHYPSQGFFTWQR